MLLRLMDDSSKLDICLMYISSLPIRGCEEFQGRFTNIVHILSPETDNCPS